MSMNGWIKISRSVFDHWIFTDPWKFRNWIDLIGMVNFTDQKVEINGMLLICKRGETLRSLETLAKRWNCDKSKVRRFLKLLEQDNMIVLTNETKTTRITICNYESYQEEIVISETQVKRKQNAGEKQVNPNKESKEIKKEKFKESLIPFLEEYGRDMLNEFFMYWTEDTPDGKMRFQKQVAFSVQRRLITWRRNDDSYTKKEASGDELVNNIKRKLEGK
jgi:hypothetical protein